MTAFGSLCTEILPLLGEPATGSARYTSALLLAAGNQCMKELSRLLPVMATTAIAPINGRAYYTLPADFVSLYAVEYPSGYLGTHGSVPQVDETRTSAWVKMLEIPYSREASYAYYAVGSTLTLVPAPDTSTDVGDINVFYYRARSLLTGTASVLDCAFREEAMVSIYIQACCIQSKVSPDANLSRWTEGQRRDDSPVISPASSLFTMFYKMVREQQEEAEAGETMVTFGGRWQFR